MLSPANFYKGQCCYKTCANDCVHVAERYSYESSGRLYDITLFPDIVRYQVNGSTLTADEARKIHVFRAITERFNLQVSV